MPQKWSDILDETVMRQADRLFERAEMERKAGRSICPPQDKIYAALKLTPPENVKVCIIGQDPYHTPDTADGLAFSSQRTIPPSLANIYKELTDDLKIPMPSTGSLTPWAERGVLLLNTTLTVEAHRPNSHREWGWTLFTKHIYQTALSLPQPVVFLLWGKNAGEFSADTDWSRYPNKGVIQSSHPSPYSAHMGFFKSRPFSRANQFLIRHGQSPVDWRLP